MKNEAANESNAEAKPAKGGNGAKQNRPQAEKSHPLGARDLMEREKLRLKTILIDELKKRESLKQEILNEIKPKNKFSDALKHPASLLLLTFIFTGIIGAGLSQYWQSKEWRKQQALLSRQKQLDEKYKIANEVAEAVGQTHAATSSILNLILVVESDKQVAEELPERVKRWEQVKQDWLVNSSVLMQKLTVHFSTDPQNPTNSAKAIFDDIFDLRKQANNRIPSLVSKLQKSRGQRTDEIVGEAKQILEILNTTKYNKALPLMERMAAEIHADADPPNPEGLKLPFTQFGRGKQ